jgi:hypothetical protein
MNIEGLRIGQTEDAGSRLNSLYRTIPRWREIAAAVRAGRAEFQRLLVTSGLLELGTSTSVVHPDQDMEIHAFVLGIVSEDRWDEIQAKSFLTYASHWIDDFFDSPFKVGDPAQLLRDRHDIEQALANMGPVGAVGFAMASRVPHPEAIHKTLHRMLYGGLVQRCHDCAERQKLVREYQDVAARFVAVPLVERIRELQPEAYWTTNKSVLEISNAAERDLDFTMEELWNLVYAPALYYQDADAERARGAELRGTGRAPIVRNGEDDPAGRQASRRDIRTRQSADAPARVRGAILRQSAGRGHK